MARDIYKIMNSIIPIKSCLTKFRRFLQGRLTVAIKLSAAAFRD